MKRPSKYRNKPTIVDGIKFQSAKEARRYGELKLLEKYGQISELRLQEPFEIKVCGQKICKYIADFQYVENGKKIVEDVKGMPTREYVLKKKLMKAVHNIEILES